MSYTSLTHKIVSIRKPHQCYACLNKSEPPEQMLYQTGVFDGDIVSGYMCLICNEFMTPEKWRDYDHEMPEGGILEDKDYKDFRTNKLTTTPTI